MLSCQRDAGLDGFAAPMDAKSCAAGAGNAYAADITPGAYALDQGLQALGDRQSRYAIDRFKVAASRGAKIAEYNLGLMYWNGDGAPKDHARAVAWLALADERPNSAAIEGSLQFAYGKLTAAEHQQTDADFNRMVKTCSDAVALTRARTAWLQQAHAQTGSRLGTGGDVTASCRIHGEMRACPDSAHADASVLACNRYWPYPLAEHRAQNPGGSSSNATSTTERCSVVARSRTHHAIAQCRRADAG